MRKVILSMHVTLDGFVAGPNREMDWITMDDEEMGKYLITDLLSTVDTMLLGRVLYKGFKITGQRRQGNNHLNKKG